MECHKEDRHGTASHKKTLYICAIGSGCFFAVMDNLLTLQSSINVKKGLGSTSAVLVGLGDFVNSLLLCSIFLKFLQPKMSLILGELVGTLYTVANFYPVWSTMILGSLSLGIGESLTEVASTTIVAFAGNSESEHQKNIGIMVIISSACHVIVSLLTELILTVIKGNPQTGFNETVYNNASEVQNSEKNNTSQDFSRCGPHDCPAEYSYKQHSKIFERLIPNRASLYVLLSVYVFFQLAGVGLQWFGLHRDVAKDEEGVPLIEPQNDVSVAKKFTLVWKQLLRHLSSLQAILVLPVQILTGMSMSFFWNEYSRAYISCTIGVEHIGICLTVYYLLTMIAGIALQRSHRLGALVVMFACAVLCLANFTACLLWTPAPTDLYLLYILAGLIGIQYGTLQFSSLLTSVVYFSDHKTTLSVQMAMLAVGYMLTFSWSVALCVYVKLYILLALTIISVLCWAIVHIRYRKIGIV